MKENEADSDLIFKLYPPQAIISTWEQFSPVILRTREKRNNPEHLASFEYLYNNIKKRYPNILPKGNEFEY